MDLTDEQWAVIQPLIPDPPKRPDGKGRPWKDARDVINGVLWALRTGAPWYDLPDRYPPYQTCHRRFQHWVRSGVFEKVLQTLADDLQERGGIDLSECHIDVRLSSPKKGRPSWSNQAGQGYEAHGSCRRQWPSCRRTRYVCFAA